MNDEAGNRCILLMHKYPMIFSILYICFFWSDNAKSICKCFGVIVIAVWQHLILGIRVCICEMEYGWNISRSERNLVREKISMNVMRYCKATEVY